MKETDLFFPVRDYLMALGYDVQGEILAADIFAKKEDDIIIVELKLTISLKLIYQALERKKITDHVYIATPLSIAKSHHRNNPQFYDLLKRLGVGLLAVNNQQVTCLLASDHSEPMKKKYQKKKLLI